MAVLRAPSLAAMPLQQAAHYVQRLRLLAAALALLLLWHALAALLASELLPAPLEVGRVLARQLLDGPLPRHLAVSAYRVALSVALATAMGAPLGLLMGLSRPFYVLSAPFVYLIYPIPKIVFLPLFLVFLGLGDPSKVGMITLILVFQVLIVVRDAAQGVRPELVQSVRSLSAGAWHLLRYVYLPATLPAVLTALRISTGTAVAVLFFVESVGSSAGLGYYILVQSWQRLDYVQMYAGVVAMAALGVAAYYLLDLLQRLTCRWAQPEGG